MPAAATSSCRLVLVGAVRLGHRQLLAGVAPGQDHRRHGLTRGVDHVVEAVDAVAVPDDRGGGDRGVPRRVGGDHEPLVLEEGPVLQLRGQRPDARHHVDAARPGAVVVVGTGEAQRLEPVGQVVEGHRVRHRQDQRRPVRGLGEDLPVQVGRRDAELLVQGRGRGAQGGGRAQVAVGTPTRSARPTPGRAPSDPASTSSRTAAQSVHPMRSVPAGARPTAARELRGPVRPAPGDHTADHECQDQHAP